jgi:citrate lyase subunit beta/citryl-CoA lyase
MLGKAPSLGADELVLDLEDAVAPVDKDAARGHVIAALEGMPAGQLCAVRVNAPRSPWCHADLVALAGAPRPPATVVLPKVQSAGDLAFAERLLDGAERAARAAPIGVQALVETAAGLRALDEIVAATPRLHTLILGYADLAASLGRTRAGAARLDSWLAAQEAVLHAARAAGVQAIDGPYLGLQADAAFTAAATLARELGFDGKWAIHPAQVAPLNDLFTPGDEEVAHARAVLDALDGGAPGAVALAGEMIDEASAAAARRLIARAGAAA